MAIHWRQGSHDGITVLTTCLRSSKTWLDPDQTVVIVGILVVPVYEGQIDAKPQEDTNELEEFLPRCVNSVSNINGVKNNNETDTMKQEKL